MLIPIFKEINFTKWNTQELEEEVLELEIGQAPYYIKIEGMELYQFEIKIDLLAAVFKKLKISQSMPYPFIIISEHHTKKSYFEILASEEELLPFFYKESKAPNKKELALLQKIAFLTHKLNNYNLDKFKKVKEKIKDQQHLLINAVREKSFYLAIDQQLTDNEDDPKV